VLSLYLPAFLVALLVTVLEMTEVVAVVFALSAAQRSVRPGAWGAVAGTGVVALAALGFGAVLIALPRSYLLWAAAVVLAFFAVFLLRSTWRSYLRTSRRASAPSPEVPHERDSVQFAGGFAVGVVESIETVIVLLALAAAGYAFSAAVGAIVGGVALVAAALIVHEQIRKIKVPWLKLGATSVLISFAIYWAGEAAGVRWPGSDLILIPLVIAVAIGVRSAIGVGVRYSIRVDTKG
jgi:Ca2+/H+ antiporter, TMEM165/GDT1 family